MGTDNETVLKAVWDYSVPVSVTIVCCLALFAWLNSCAEKREAAAPHYTVEQSKEYLCENYPSYKCKVNPDGTIKIKGM